MWSGFGEELLCFLAFKIKPDVESQAESGSARFGIQALRCVKEYLPAVKTIKILRKRYWVNLVPPFTVMFLVHQMWLRADSWKLCTRISLLLCVHQASCVQKNASSTSAAHTFGNRLLTLSLNRLSHFCL